MKKIIAVLLVLALASLAFTACGSEKAPESKIDGYLETLAASADAWMDEELALYDTYAVTDMDEDGCPEIILTRCQGSGFFSETCMWRVSEDGEALLEVTDGTEYGLQSDLCMSQEYRCYTEDGINYIIAEDYLRNGMAENYCDRYAVWYDGSEINEEYLAGFSAIASYEGEYEGFEKTYFVNGEEVDAENYVSCDSERFIAASAVRIMDIAWFDIEEPESITSEEILKLVKESWGGFGFRISSEDDGLLPDPGKDYPDPEYSEENLDEGVPPVEALHDNWYLYSGETEGWEWIAEDEGVECSMVFRGTSASFRYKFDGGEQVFENMPFEVREEELYSSCGNDEWSVFCKDESGENEFYASVTQPGVLQVLWMQYEGLEEDEYPAVCAMVFYNGL